MKIKLNLTKYFLFKMNNEHKKIIYYQKIDIKKELNFKNLLSGVCIFFIF